MNEIDKNTEISTKDPLLRKAMYDVFDGKCFYSGRELSFDEIEIDHIIPKSKGGKNCIANYTLSCNYINIKKNGNFYKDLVKITKEVVNSIFTDNVVNRYNQLKINNNIIDTHIDINEFFGNREFNDHTLRNKFRSYVRNVLTPIKIYPILKNGKRGVKPKVCYDKKELINSMNIWLTKQTI
jgi:CRISPR/Cas system Type II protein with McrA/HNH and RuvC-like nuclease domain